jgi:hypothetical protein
MIRPHAVAIICLVLLSGCVTAVDQPRLSRQTALRIAAGSIADVLESYHPPATFQPAEATYYADERMWYVPYRRVGQRYADFSVRVDDRTRKATVEMP